MSPIKFTIEDVVKSNLCLFYELSINSPTITCDCILLNERYANLGIWIDTSEEKFHEIWDYLNDTYSHLKFTYQENNRHLGFCLFVDEWDLWDRFCEYRANTQFSGRP